LLRDPIRGIYAGAGEIIAANKLRADPFEEAVDIDCGGVVLWHVRRGMRRGKKNERDKE